MDLQPHFDEFPTASVEERWLEHPARQPTRSSVERLHSITDRGEAIVATNLCCEPTVKLEIGSERSAKRSASTSTDTRSSTRCHP
ncbi:hypothetical protein [Paraconexibacter antarcticus]|uniref:hypothetical protein n=1 Tax=Paraconexibacter antarcticus TaxID=2949664 RepID=UPI00345F5363